MWVLVMFLGLNWLKSDDLGSKWRILGFKKVGKDHKTPELVVVGPNNDLDWRVVVQLAIENFGSVGWVCSTGLY